MFFNFDSDGRAKMTTTAPFGAVFMGGSAYNSSGELHVSYDTPASTDPRIGGIAHKPTGEVYVTADTSGSVYHGGLRLSANGAVCVAEGGTTANQSGGLPFASDGRLVSVGAYAGLGASDYDGTNDYATRGAGLTGAVDGKQGTVSFWLRVDGGDGAQRLIFFGLDRLAILQDTDNKIYVLGNNAAGVQILNISSGNAYPSGSAWIHVLASWNLASVGASHLYTNDGSDRVVTTFTNDTLDYTVADWSVGAGNVGALKFNGGISELYFHPSYIDLSVEANRRKFITAAGKPAFLGADGSLPLGVQPLVYAPSGDPSSNRGGGGNFTVTGALDAASTTPFDQTVAAFSPILPAQLSDNGYSTDQTNYYQSSANARLVVQTTATKADISYYVNPAIFPVYGSDALQIAIYDGTTRQIHEPTAAGLNRKNFTLAAGTKTVEVTSGIQGLISSVVEGSFLTRAAFFGETTLLSPSPSPRILVYGDSISAGAGADIPPTEGWAMLLRAGYADTGSVMLEAWGSRQLRDDAATSGARTTFAARLASYEPDIVWIAVGVNDYLLAEWNAAAFGAAYADLLDEIHAAAPSAAIYAQSPIDKTDESANAVGSTLPNYRTAISDACAGRAWATYVDGTAFMATTDLMDGLHPSTIGHELYYGSVATTLGIHAGTLQFSASNYNVNDNAGNVTITVTRTGGSAGAIAVNYATSNGTATQPGDYTSTSGTLNWADGETANKTFQVPIVNDIDAVSETVNLTLSSPTNGSSLGVQRTATITIVPSL